MNNKKGIAMSSLPKNKKERKKISAIPCCAIFFKTNPEGRTYELKLRFNSPVRPAGGLKQKSEV